MICALVSWEHLLLGTKFVVITDNQALTQFQLQKTFSRRQLRYLDFISRFDFEIRYVPSKKNLLADDYQDIMNYISF